MNATYMVDLHLLRNNDTFKSIFVVQNSLDLDKSNFITQMAPFYQVSCTWTWVQFKAKDSAWRQLEEQLQKDFGTFLE